MSYFMHDLTWPEFNDKKDKVVILPIGSTEQHALHLPLCTDAKIAEQFFSTFSRKNRWSSNADNCLWL